MSRQAKIFGLIGLSGIALPCAAAAQMSTGEIDYSALVQEKPQAVNDESWRPLLEVVLKETEHQAPAANALARHASAETMSYASRGAMFLPDENGKGGTLFLPANQELVSRLNNGGCQTLTVTSPSLDPSGAVMAGEGASFSLSAMPSDCQTPGISFDNSSDKDAPQDVELHLSPALADCGDGSCRMRGVKGEIRVGEFRESADAEGSGWYMYAAADGTRVVWDERPSGFADLPNAIEVSDSLTMGDLEAGIMLSRGTADVSLNYVHRRAKFENWSEKVVDNADYIGVKLSFD